VPILLFAASSGFSQTVNCQEDFLKLRQDAEAKGKAIQEAANRKASAVEVCPLFRRFGEAEAKVVRFLADNAAWCQIPPQVIQSAKQAHAKTLEIRGRVCAAANNPVAPATPSLGLSGALTTTPGPAPSTGTGVFDTLTGNVLQR
jgi:hypothetical protein